MIAGFDEQRLEAVGRMCHRYVDDEILPFTMVQVGRHGEVVYRDIYGWADVEAKRKITEDAIVRIYSMTKPITSIAMMQLVEQGLVLLEDPISAYLPEFENLRVWDGGTIDAPETRAPSRIPTVKDVMTHQAGFTYGFMSQHQVDAMYRRDNIGVLDEGGFDLAEFVARLAKIPLLNDPGTDWDYSVSTDVVGAIIEVVTGVKLDEYFDAHILGPLGMVDTHFEVPPDKAHRLTNNYSTAKMIATHFGKPVEGDPTKLVVTDHASTSPYLGPMKFLSGGGGLVSTLDDYQRFCDMLINRGRVGDHTIIGPRTLKYMTRNHIYGGKTLAELPQTAFAEVSTDGMGFGLGFAPVLNAAENGSMASDGEYSWGGAASTVFWIDPTEEISVVFYTQLIPSSEYPIRRQLRATVMAALID